MAGKLRHILSAAVKLCLLADSLTQHPVSSCGPSSRGYLSEVLLCLRWVWSYDHAAKWHSLCGVMNTGNSSTICHLHGTDHCRILKANVHSSARHLHDAEWQGLLEQAIY